MTRRELLAALGGTTVALTTARARAAAQASRVIFFYFPDGVPGRSTAGEPSLWSAGGADAAYALPDLLAPLAPFRDACILTSGLSMGPADAGSHPGGAKKLLTGVDGGRGESIDQ
jgi:hypothetical protein